MNTIEIDLRQSQGPIKPMHGINNGPISYGGLTNTSEQYREAGFPIVRLHDPDWPNPYQVDIPKVFPNFDADPDDPDAYRFAQTDDLIAAIHATGAEVLYRLGVSIEHIRERIYARKPTDFEKWARICTNVIRHYNEGWCNGFHYGIRFWEIWNEPDGGDNMWTDGTPEDYYRLYCTASKIIRAACPNVLLGGYAGCTVYNEPFMTGFFESIRAANAPLDFFSWHMYSDGGNAPDYAKAAAVARQYLVKYGYSNALSICDEWNYMAGKEHWDAVRGEPDNLIRKKMFELQRTMVGASFCVAAMISMQNAPMDMAAYYDGQPHMLWCGIFDFYGAATKTFYAFKAYDQLYRLKGSQIPLQSIDKLYALAAGKARQALVLLANHDEPDAEIELIFKGMSSSAQCTLSLLDDNHDLVPLRTEIFHGQSIQMRVFMKRNTVALVHLEEIQQ